MISGILLAAGNSTRMGEANKLLLTLNGKTLFEHMLGVLMESRLDELVVVLGHEYKKMIPFCNSSRLKLAINGDHLQKQTTSIQAGMHLINPSTDAVMICLADMPLIQSKHINELIDHQVEGHILRVMNKEVPGNPSIFPKQLFKSLENCPDKNGCKSVIQENQSLVNIFETSDEAYFSDIDTPTEYAKFAL